MGAIQGEAVCLRCWDFSETSQTVSLLTRDLGVVRGLAKGSRRDKSAFSGGFEPVTAGQFVAYRKPTSELATLASWSLDRPFRSARTDLTTHYAACYVCDLVHHAVRQDDPHPALYDAVLAFLVSADRSARDPAPKARREALRDAGLLRVQWSLLNEIGYRPELDRDVRTDRPLPEPLSGQDAYLFDGARGGLTLAGTPSRRDLLWPVRVETVEVLRRVRDHPRGPEDAASTPGAPRARIPVVSRASRLLATYSGVVLGRAVPSVRFVYPDAARRVASTTRG